MLAHIKPKLLGLGHLDFWHIYHPHVHSANTSATTLHAYQELAWHSSGTSHRYLQASANENASAICLLIGRVVARSCRQATMYVQRISRQVGIIHRSLRQ